MREAELQFSNVVLLKLLAQPNGLDATAAAALSSLPCHELQLPRGAELPVDSNAIFIPLEGWLCGCKFLGDGNRQICSIHIPGDVLDFHSLLWPGSILKYFALTPCQLGLVPKADLLAACKESPALALAIFRESAKNAAILLEWIANIGSQRAIKKVAHLICELAFRLDAAGNARTAYQIPLTQVDLGDATGMSAVHVNRVLQELRNATLLELAGQRIMIPDRQRLAEFAGFDPKYLQHQEADGCFFHTSMPRPAHANYPESSRNHNPQVSVAPVNQKSQRAWP
jgi:CRP-like cAMP-binding protein